MLTGSLQSTQMSNRGREPKEPPPGSFGAGGWQTGGNGKYPRPSFEECERIRIDFRNMLIKKYGNVVGAWRDMDKNQDGKLSFQEFLRACNNLHVQKGARRIWAALDLDRSGFVSLAEVDPGLVELLGTLAVTIWSVCGTVEKAWVHCFNRRGVLRITAEEFMMACDEIGFQGDALSAFVELASDRASTGITRQEFGFLHHWISNGQPDRVGSEEKPSRWAAEVQKWLPPVTPPPPSTSVRDFKHLLLKSYMNFVRAWRLGLDRDHNGYLDYTEFKFAVKDVGYAGNPRELWGELDKNKNNKVSLRELDAPTAQVLADFNDIAVAKYGTWERAWQQAFDLRFDDRVKLMDFREGCITMGYEGTPECTIENLFDMLDIDRSKYLSYDELTWISGTELAEPKDVDRQDLGMISVSGKFKKLTRLQRRRADINLRDFRMRAKKFEGRARGEIPGSNPSAGTSHFSPGVSFNSHLGMSSSAPTLGAEPKPKEHKGYWKAVEEPDYPEWMLIAEGRAKSPEPKKKFDLSFPMKPQAPGKGGWPSRKLRLVDHWWGGSKNLADNLSTLALKACTQHNLDRWQRQSLEEDIPRLA